MSGPDGVYRISLLLSLIGLITIYASSMLFQPETTDVGDIDRDDIGEAVRVTGTVSGYSSTDGTAFFDVEGGGGAIKAVHFGTGLEVEEGAEYTFRGRVDIYQGELELVVENVVSGGSSPPYPG